MKKQRHTNTEEQKHKGI